MFPNFTLELGQAVTVHTGSGVDNKTDLYWGSNRPVWDNKGDTVYLLDPKGRWWIAMNGDRKAKVLLMCALIWAVGATFWLFRAFTSAGLSKYFNAFLGLFWFVVSVAYFKGHRELRT